MKIAITAVVTAAICFAITATTGFASSPPFWITIHKGQAAYIGSIQKPGGITCHLDGTSFECDNGGEQWPTGATVAWFNNRVEIQSRATPTSTRLKGSPGWVLWRISTSNP